MTKSEVTYTQVNTMLANGGARTKMDAFEKVAAAEGATVQAVSARYYQHRYRLEGPSRRRRAAVEVPTKRDLQRLINRGIRSSERRIEVLQLELAEANRDREEWKEYDASLLGAERKADAETPTAGWAGTAD